MMPVYGPPCRLSVCSNSQRLTADTSRAAEFFNEPNVATLGGVPPGYAGEDYGRDFQIFHAYMQEAAPDMKIIGPGSVMESTGDWLPSRENSQLGLISTEALLEHSGDAPIGAFSYHHYGSAFFALCGHGHADNARICPHRRLAP